MSSTPSFVGHPEVVAASKDYDWIEQNRPASDAIDEFADLLGCNDQICANECGHCHACGVHYALSWMQAVLSNRGLLVMARLRAQFKQAQQAEAPEDAQ